MIDSILKIFTGSTLFIIKRIYDELDAHKQSLTNISVFDDDRFIGIFSASFLFHHTAKTAEDVVSMNETTLANIK